MKIIGLILTILSLLVMLFHFEIGVFTFGLALITFGFHHLMVKNQSFTYIYLISGIVFIIGPFIIL